MLGIILKPKVPSVIYNFVRESESPQIGINLRRRRHTEQRIKTMNTINAALFILVWTCTAVCRADDVCSVSCEDVTGTVGEEVTFTCSISQKCSECIKMYKFQYPEKDDSICRQEFPLKPCEQRNSFTCRYTPTTAMTGQFRFFVQTKSEAIKTKFTVNITEPRIPETVTALHKETPSPTGKHFESRKGDNTRSNGTVVAAVVACFFISIIIIIIIAIIYKKKPNYIKLSQLQKWVFLGRRQEQSPQNEVNSTDSTV